MHKVKLISKSHDDLEQLIVDCARVSNPANQGKPGKKLLEYLIREKHWSPFEMANVCLEIETTRDIARQILRHRSFAFQEFSQRYADPTEHLHFVERSARLQDEKNRQNSIDTDDLELDAEWKYRQRMVSDLAMDQYRWAIQHNIAKEQARAVLPEGLTVSRLYMNGTLRSWIHYIQVRDGNGTQKEHMEIAQACKKEIAKVFPLIEILS